MLVVLCGLDMSSYPPCAGTVHVNLKVFNFILALSASVLQCDVEDGPIIILILFARQGRQKIFHILLIHKYKSEEKKRSHIDGN